MATSTKDSARVESAPLVSLIITTYNRCEMLMHCVSTALAQKYKNLEIIVADNASSDGTDQKMRQLSKRHAKLKYFRHGHNIGADANFLYAIKELGQGEWVLMVSDDDFITNDNFLKNAMSEIGSLVKQRKPVAFYQSAVKVQDEKKGISYDVCPPINGTSRTFSTGEYFIAYPDLRFFTFTTTLFNRRLLTKIIQNEKHGYWLDVNLMLALSLHGYVILAKSVDGVYRIHKNQNYANSGLLALIKLYRIYISSANYAFQMNLPASAGAIWLRKMKQVFYDNIVEVFFRRL
ncbi:MAG: glycosyltransferase, partial [Spirochaetes bacterium]|nr:glycosyltransferase [Spirochaetota bacterium]